MVKEKVRLGETLTLPNQVQEALHATVGDELTVLYHENGILIIKDLDDLPESLTAFIEMTSLTGEDYRVRIAEMAAEYETSALAQLAAEYERPDRPMSADLESLYLEAEREVHESHLPPLHEGMTVDLPSAFPTQPQAESDE